MSDEEQSQERDPVPMDCLVGKWKLNEQMAYREKVGVNPQFALLKIGQALESDDPERYANIDPIWLLGIAWITARRTEKHIDMMEMSERLEFGDLLTGIQVWADQQQELIEAARPTRAPRSSARTKKS